VERLIDDGTALAERLNTVLQSRHGSNIRIINDKLTLSMFSLLANNLSRVGRIQFILRDSRTLPSDPSVAREFDLALDPNDALFGQYDILEKNQLRHFADASAMHDFIESHVQVRRVRNPDIIRGNVLLVDDDLMIAGSSSLELSPKYVKNSRQSINFDAMVSCAEDAAQIRDARQKFERAWNDPSFTDDFKDELLARLRYVYMDHSPAFLYYFTLRDVFADRLDSTLERLERDPTRFKDTEIWNKLYDFQKDAVLSALQKLHNYGGCIIADSVGLGKTFEALAVIKYFEMRNDNVLVLTPAKMYPNWMSFKGLYKDSLIKDEFHYKIMFHTDLSRHYGNSKSGYDLARFDWSRFDLIVIDESHNFRNREYRDEGFTRYQRLMEEVLRQGQRTKVLLLSATPVNNSLVDLKNQISLITADRDDAFAEEGIASVHKTLARAAIMLSQWSDGPERRKATIFDALPADFYLLLEMITISRSRKHITRYYKSEGLGAFPEKRKPETYTPAIDRDNELLRFAETNKVLERLNLSVYTPMAYIKPRFRTLYREKYQTVVKGQATFFQENRETSVKTLHRFNLFKRLESSVYSFGETVDRLLERIENLIGQLASSASGEIEDSIDDEAVDAEDDEAAAIGKLKIKVEHIEVQDYLHDLRYDREQLLALQGDILRVLNENRDEKLHVLLDVLRRKIAETPYNPDNRKVLIFTAFADTADYLFRHLSKEFKPGKVHTGMVSGSRPAEADNYALVQQFENILNAFSPLSRLGKDIPASDHLTFLIGTDCISEGQNLQDCDCVVNYDIHWNPVRLIQRFGRIDRIGSRNKQIQMINFFPHLELNEYLSLESRIKGKMLAVNIASTGDEDLLAPERNDLNFRMRQLERLREEVADLEEAQDSISLTDLNLNDYLFELSEYTKLHPELAKAARGIYAVTDTAVANMENGQPAPRGVIFCFKHRGHDGKPQSQSALYPYYLLYMDRGGTLLHGNGATRETLKRFRALCQGKDKPNPDLVKAFLAETWDARDMSLYSDLLSKGIKTIRDGEAAHAETSVLDFSGFANSFAADTRDDFELVSFLVVG
jgi:SNF2 family DNA or RNA helicase